MWPNKNKQKLKKKQRETRGNMETRRNCRKQCKRGKKSLTMNRRVAIKINTNVITKDDDDMWNGKEINGYVESK